MGKMVSIWRRRGNAPVSRCLDLEDWGKQGAKATIDADSVQASIIPCTYTETEGMRVVEKCHLRFSPIVTGNPSTLEMAIEIQTGQPNMVLIVMTVDD